MVIRCSSIQSLFLVFYIGPNLIIGSLAFLLDLSSICVSWLSAAVSVYESEASVFIPRHYEFLMNLKLTEFRGLKARL